ncbi:hypothetical protein [Sporosarcina sp. HYO08]|uniref:hypothetical protein n=1 Tax=Sporosarcina sp. HYO08 TaxID=1759557 RepID=UPI000796A92D|nr:hypothetical protein [Sporosarcina sp. HYO08]KXH79323.1 hypothetical protein AU377_12140 [Sporosarcina sp. HYO08]
MNHRHYMRIALDLARHAKGQTSPNPSVNKTGIGLLRVAGIDVVTGILPEEAEQLNRVFFYF